VVYRHPPLHHNQQNHARTSRQKGPERSPSKAMTAKAITPLEHYCSRQLWWCCRPASFFCLGVLQPHTHHGQQGARTCSACGGLRGAPRRRAAAARRSCRAGHPSMNAGCCQQGQDGRWRGTWGRRGRLASHSGGRGALEVGLDPSSTPKCFPRSCTTTGCQSQQEQE
jgi:hypothetical protein